MAPLRYHGRFGSRLNVVGLELNVVGLKMITLRPGHMLISICVPSLVYYLQMCERTNILRPAYSISVAYCCCGYAQTDKSSVHSWGRNTTKEINTGGQGCDKAA